MKNIFKYITCRQLAVFFLSVLIIACNSSCDKMKDNYMDYLAGGEIIYPGKADSLKTYPGKNRIQVQWLLKSDPSITSAKIYWSNKENFREVPIIRTSGIDTINVLLENMEEQTYTFEVYTFDNVGNKSVASEAIGTVYGDKYRSTLLNRALQGVNLTEEGDLEIIWEAADEGTVAEELTYSDTDGKTHSVSFDVSQDTISLVKFDLSGSLWMSTVFMPNPVAIDTFKVAPEEIAFDIVETVAEVDRSNFSVKDLPGDKNEPNNVNNALSKIWTNDYSTEGTPYISRAWAITACNDLWALPYWFTIDLGAAYDLSSLTLWQRGGSGQLYANNNLKEFEIWGALEVDENYNPADHGNVFDDNWTLLESCEIIRPDDPATWASVAAKGHEFDLRVNGNTKKIRYLRFKVIDNWLLDTGSCPLVKKRTYINIASIRLDAVQRIVQLK